MVKILKTSKIVTLVLILCISANGDESQDSGVTLIGLTNELCGDFVYSPLTASELSPCEGNNHEDDNHIDNGGYMGGPLTAISWIPLSSVTVTRVEVFTGYVIRQNAIAIWSDDGGNPSKPLNALGYSDHFETVPENSWQGANLISPVSVTAGTRYWVVWDPEGSELISRTPDPGIQQTYWGSYSGTVAGGASWYGPFSSYRWKFRMFCGGVSPDSEGPITSNVAAVPNPVATNSSVTLTANVDDSTTGESEIQEADYSLDGTNWYPMEAQDGLFDSVSENVSATFTAPGTTGIYGIAVLGIDAVPNMGDPEVIMIVVYDPSCGFVTGGGWIDSPVDERYYYMHAGGKATFGFVSKYNKGASVPAGNTEFQFKAGNLSFHSSSYDWLVVAGPKAMFKGVGTINGAGEYGFMLSAVDAALTPSTSEDRFRIKIWDKNADDTVVYDNQIGDDDNADVTTAIGGGSIVIHAK